VHARAQEDSDAGAADTRTCSKLLSYEAVCHAWHRVTLLGPPVLLDNDVVVPRHEKLHGKRGVIAVGIGPRCHISLLLGALARQTIG
jgi:hypothetical protein